MKTDSSPYPLLGTDPEALWVFSAGLTLRSCFKPLWLSPSATPANENRDLHVTLRAPAESKCSHIAFSIAA